MFGGLGLSLLPPSNPQGLVSPKDKENEFQAGKEDELAFWCVGTKSRLCVGFASQNSALVV